MALYRRFNGRERYQYQRATMVEKRRRLELLKEQGRQVGEHR